MGSTFLAFMVAATGLGLYNNRAHNNVRIRSTFTIVVSLYAIKIFAVRIVNE